MEPFINIAALLRKQRELVTEFRRHRVNRIEDGQLFITGLPPIEVGDSEEVQRAHDAVRDLARATAIKALGGAVTRDISLLASVLLLDVSVWNGEEDQVCNYQVNGPFDVPPIKFTRVIPVDTYLLPRAEDRIDLYRDVLLTLFDAVVSERERRYADYWRGRKDD